MLLYFNIIVVGDKVHVNKYEMLNRPPQLFIKERTKEHEEKTNGTLLLMGN